VSHCTDRNGLLVILAIGGSVVAIGGAAGQPISMPRLVTVAVLLLALPAATFLLPLFGLAGLVLSCLQVILEEE
jgi:low temperature requirement protein LtrA